MKFFYPKLLEYLSSLIGLPAKFLGHYRQILFLIFILPIYNISISQTTYSTPGTYSYTVPSGVTSVTILCWGAGGGSGGSYGNNSHQAAGGGGGGAFCQNSFTVTPGQALTVVVGAGGAAGLNTGTNGGTGGTSSVNSSSGPSVSISASGGTGGGGVSTAGGAGTAGAGATAGTGYSIIYAGGNGTVGVVNNFLEVGGAGGGGAGNGGAGGNGTAGGVTFFGTNSTGGSGGSGSYAGGAGSGATVTTGSNAGVLGNAPGGGAAGGAATSTSQQPGAAGGSGQVVILSNCTTPSAPTGFIAGTPTTTTATASFTAASPVPTGYLVIMSTSSSLSASPVTGTSYTVGSTLGGGTVEQLGTSTSISLTGLTANTKYYFFIYSYNNTSCAAGPAYSSTPLTGNLTTCVGTPTVSAATGISGTGFTANWTAPSGGTGASVTYTLDVSLTTTFGSGNDISGYPLSGITGTSQSVTGLSAGVVYYYQVTSSNGICGNTSSSTSATTTSNTQTYYPGGMGNTNLVLWLTNTDPTTVLNSSQSQASSGNSVILWKDKSGLLANAIQTSSSSQPVYQANQLNGWGSVTFGNTSTYMTGPSGAYQTIIATRAVNGYTTNKYHYLFSSPANADFSIRNSGSGPGSYTVAYTDGPNVNDWAYVSTGTPPMWIDGVQSLNGSHTNHILVVQSQNPTNSTYSLSNYNPTAAWGNRGLFGNDPIYELIAYKTVLNNTQRHLLENYEASEWGLTGNLPTSGYTIFTPPSSTTFNKNLVGIGNSGTDNFAADVSGSTDGLGFSSSTGSTGFLHSAGYIMAAHNGQANTIITNANVPGIPGNTNIWNRSWYMQKSGGNSSGNVTITFYFNDYNSTLSPSGAYSYGLLYNPTDGTFATGTNTFLFPSYGPYAPTVSTNTVTFNNVPVSSLSNGYYTLVWSTFGPLTITLNNFTAIRQGATSLLQWSTQQETNSDYFDIERSANGIDFISIGEIKAKGNSASTSNYDFTDTKPMNGYNYYRLKMVDQNGAFSFSPVKTLEFDGNEDQGLQIYPNPVYDMLNITCPSIVGNVNLQIINTDGQLIRSFENMLFAKSLNLPVDYLVKGIYFIKISTPFTTYTRKIVKL